MSDIIIPGNGEQKKKPHIYDALRRAAETESWDYQATLNEMYDNFLQAIQQSAPKDWFKYKDEKAWSSAGAPVWDSKSTFDEWVTHSKEKNLFYLQELEKRKENSSRSMPHLITAIRQAQEDGAADLAVRGLGEEMKAEDYEIFEFFFKKNLETIAKYQSGELTVTPVNIDIQDDTLKEAIRKLIGG